MSATTEQNRSILAALAEEIAAVLLYISVAGINITIKATGKVPKGTQDKNSRRELTPRPQSSTTYWLASGLTPQLVFSCSQNHLPRDGIAHIGLHELALMKMLKTPDHRPI